MATKAQNLQVPPKPEGLLKKQERNTKLALTLQSARQARR
jgi:hypothetical protein